MRHNSQHFRRRFDDANSVRITTIDGWYLEFYGRMILSAGIKRGTRFHF